MAKTQYYTATSIDGFIADENNSLEWLFQIVSGPQASTDKEDRFRSFFSDVGAMAMGATTYEWVVTHESLLEHPEKWHEFYADVPCWVFTHRALPSIPGVDLSFVRDDVAGVHESMLRAADGKNVWLVGGGDWSVSSPTSGSSTRSCWASPR
jgi:dihydrofolate reductase